MARPTKKQVNIKMPLALIEALKTKAEAEKTTFTDLVIEACKQMLDQSEHSDPASAAISAAQVDKGIAPKIALLQEKVATLELALEKPSA